MKPIRAILGDPSWQGISAALTVVAILLSLYTLFAQTGELALTGIALSSLEYQVPGASVQITPKGTDKPLTAGTIEYVIFKNRGLRAIRPADYSSPLTIRSTTRKIVAVIPCPKGITFNESTNLLQVTWKPSEDAWVAENALFNASESACVAVIYGDTFTAEKKLNNFTIEGHVADTRLVHYTSFSEFARGDPDFLFYFSVSLSGRQIYVFLLLQMSIFLVDLILLDTSERLRPRSLQYRIGITAILVLSTASAESIIFVLSSVSLNATHPIVWPILGLQSAVFLYLVIRSLKQLLQRIRTHSP